MTPDLLRVCFSSERDSVGTLHIYCATRATRSGQFGAPVSQTAINSGSEDTAPFIWRNRLYFSSTRAGSHDLYVATWDESSHAYKDAQPIAELNTSSLDKCPALSADGLTIYFESDRPGGLGLRDIWSATRTSPDGAFGSALNVTAVNTAGEDVAPSVAADGSFLLVSSVGRAGGRANSNGWIARASPTGGWQTPTPASVALPLGWSVRDLRALPDGPLSASVRLGDFQEDLAVIPPGHQFRAPTRAWGRPVPMTALNTSGWEGQGTMTADRLRICFYEAPSGSQTDIWCATRANASEGFGAPVAQSAINTSVNESQPELSADGTELFYTSMNSGHAEIWRATWNATSQRYESGAVVPNINVGTTTTLGASLSGDDLVMVFAAERPGLQLYITARRTRSSAFGVPAPLTELNDGHAGEPGFSADGSMLIFSSDRVAPGESGAQSYRLWTAGWKGDGHFTAPVLLTMGSTQGIAGWGAEPLADGSLLFHSLYQQPTAGNDDMYIAPAAGSTEAGLPRLWTGPSLLPELAAPAYQSHPSLSADGLRICFDSARSGGAGGTDIWCAERSTATGAFGAPVNQVAVNTTDDEWGPTPRGTELYFSRNVNARYTTLRATWNTSTHQYVSPAPVMAVNAETLDTAPSLTGDGLTIFWQSLRTGSAGVDIYSATRSSLISAFGIAYNAVGINTSASEAFPGIAPDASFLTFVSDRAGTPANNRVYMSEAQANHTWGPARVIPVFVPPEWELESARPMPDGSVMGACKIGAGNYFLCAFRPDTTNRAGEICGEREGRWTFAANGPCFGHFVGQRDAVGWTATVGSQSADFLAIGPYTAEVPEGEHTATFRLRVPMLAGTPEVIATIDVNDPNTNTSLAKKDLHLSDFAQADEDATFTVPFSSVWPHWLEFRVFWTAKSDVTFRDVVVE